MSSTLLLHSRLEAAHHNSGKADRPTFAFCGFHVVADFYLTDLIVIVDTKLITDALRQGAIKAGATICDVALKSFPSGGITAIALLSESHASVHTYPEHAAAFVDAFTCGASCNPQRLIEHMLEVLKPRACRISTVGRGDGVPFHAKALGEGTMESIK